MARPAKKMVEKLPKGISRMTNGNYRVSICVDGKRKTKVCETLDEATALCEEFRTALVNGEDEPIASPRQQKALEDDWTLEYAIDKTFSLVWRDMRSEKWCREICGSLVRFFGADTKLKDITLNKIDAYTEELLNIGNSGSTVNRKLSCLSRVLRTAYERDKLKVMPRIPRKKEGTHRIRFLTPDEETRLITIFEQWGYPDHRDAAAMLIYTGFRCGELWRLECRDIDLENGLMTTWKTKTDKPRSIPIAAPIRQIVEQRIKAVDGVGPLFPGADNRWFRQVWDRVRAYLGMDTDPQFVPHMLRHTCATRLAQRGASMVIIREWMGHADIQTTARYTHFAPKDLQNAAKLLGN